MINKILICLVLLKTISASAQTVEETFPKTLWCSNDTFSIRFEGSPGLSHYTASRKDKISPGTDAAPGLFTTIYFGNDSLRLNYHNKLPYAHIIYLNFESPKGKTKLRFHFNQLYSYFPGSYIKQNTGNVQIDIPEVYELANIIWTLSPSGARSKDLYKTGEYYDRVRAYFKPYLNHPIFSRLDFADSVYFDNYYGFRENSFAFNFADKSSSRLLFNGPYYYVYGNDLADSSLFGLLKPLIEDFSTKSKFREFYRKNLDYYQKALQREQQLLPMKQMWTWLEDQFPKIKYNSYRVVFSPLIGGSHSTQRYSSRFNSKFFTENVMFVCGTDRYDSSVNLSEKKREGLMSGIVFTEIDHNYVNPTTNKYFSKIDSIFKNRAFWTKSGNSSDFYGSAVSVFNEYMTHAAFCLYVTDVYDNASASFVIENRERLMVSRRNFIRFKEFNQELLRLHQQNKTVKLVDLYTQMIEWCERESGKDRSSSTGQRLN